MKPHNVTTVPDERLKRAMEAENPGIQAIPTIDPSMHGKVVQGGGVAPTVVLYHSSVRVSKNGQIANFSQCGKPIGKRGAPAGSRFSVGLDGLTLKKSN